ncbi:MAG: hypothetical protein ACRELG_24715 [Gemmataceae bacterium]
MKSTFCTNRIGLVIFLMAVLCAPAFAQYGGVGSGTGGGTGSMGGVYTAPKGGYKSSTGIAIGAAAAAGLVVAYLALHKTSMVGCVEQASDALDLTSYKNKMTYRLETNGQDLIAGHQARVKGKKFKEAGNPAFRVKSFKDLGPCSTTHSQAKVEMMH